MRPPRPTHLPAAVIEDQDAPVASVVPPKAKVRKVGGAVLGYDHKPVRLRGYWTRNTQRLADVEQLISHRAMMSSYHGQIFDVPAEKYLAAIMPELLLEAGLPRRPLYRANPIIWATAMLPELLERHDHEWFDALEDEFERAHSTPRPLRADAVAKLLQVTWDERQECGITTIGAIDMTKRQQREAKKKADAEYQRAKREREGATPREKSISSAKPWEAENMGRSAWYAKQKTARTNSSATCEGSETPSWTDSSVTRNVAVGAIRTDSSAALYITRVPTNLSGPESSAQKRSDGRQTIGLPGEGNPPSASPPLIVSAQLPDARQLSFLPPPQAENELRSACDGWAFGPMPDAIRVAYIAAKRRRAMRQEDVARAIEISRPQLANALAGTFNLSPAAIERLKAWLLADDADLPSPTTWEWDRPMRPPHHRRGGKRPPDPGPAFPSLRLFGVISGPGRAASREAVAEPKQPSRNRQERSRSLLRRETLAGVPEARSRCPPCDRFRNRR